jgi:hypothetical protein
VRSCLSCALQLTRSTELTGRGGASLETMANFTDQDVKAAAGLAADALNTNGLRYTEMGQFKMAADTRPRSVRHGSKAMAIRASIPPTMRVLAALALMLAACSGELGPAGSSAKEQALNSSGVCEYPAGVDVSSNPSGPRVSQCRRSKSVSYAGSAPGVVFALRAVPVPDDVPPVRGPAFSLGCQIPERSFTSLAWGREAWRL